MSNRLHNTYHIAGMGHLRSVLVAAALTLCCGTALAGVKITGSVYGGGNQANVGETEVNVKAGEIVEAVYGGCNSEGTVSGNATVTLTGGTVGTAPGEGEAIDDVVFGGGKGEPTLVNGNVTVNVGREKTGEETNNVGTATIYGHVYGGSALGNTNAATNTGEDAATNPLVFFTIGEDKKTTNVNLYSGTINGYAFGGGLGRKEAEGVEAVESFVGGDVLVTLDGAKVQQVFGANNLNGTPKGHVTVHVKRTKNFSDAENADAYKSNSTTALADRTTYDVEAVYGGGNQADYVPADPTPETPLNDTEDYAEVLIEGCDLTSIKYVYGGGNAAAVPATLITIKSAYIIDRVFGGGNGEGAGNPGADVGVIDKDAYTADNTTGIYGTGIAKTTLVGGQIHYVYGGSNTLGNVRGGTQLKRAESNACELKVGEIYGAGQVAPMDGDVNIILECMPKSFVEAVYGGAKNAVVNGNVSLTVTSGKYGRVFGGNNEGGSINGSITVNAYEDGCQPLIIGELYGGGNAAPYSIWGCNDDDNDGTWTPNTPDPEGTPYVAADANAISVNVYSCTSIGKVFGGGYGATANVVGNTHVYINMMKGLVDNAQGVRTLQANIGKIGQVFGGGNKGVVQGNTLIDIGTALANEDNGVRIESGTDYLNPESDTNEEITAGVYGGGNEADIDGNTTLNIGTENLPLGTTITGDIFGGGLGEYTHVTGNVTVNIGTNESGTPVGYANITGDVYGGSAKGTVNSADNSAVSTYTPDPENPEETANCYTHVNFYGGTIKGNLYGGGQGQRANPEADPAVSAIAANVFGPVTVAVENGTVNNVFGCNNFYGAPKDTVAVFINGGTVSHSVYGGGDEAEYTAPAGQENYPAVYINNGIVTENVFGGGLGTTATVKGNPHVTIGDKVEGHAVTILKSVYGGGSLATVDGTTDIIVNSGTIGTEGEGGATYGNIYGGGYGSDENVRIGLVKGNTNVTVKGGSILHNIYGGGAYGSVGTYTYASEDANAAITSRPEGAENTGKATIRVVGGTVGTNGHENGMIFGASRGDIDRPGAIQDNMAWVYDTEVVIGTEGQGTTVSTPQIKGSVYGSGENGHTYHDARVTMYSGMVGITDTSIDGGAAYAYRGNVYGGGCGTDKYYSDPAAETHDGRGTLYNQIAGIVRGDATVTIDGGHVVRNVYGAGAMGSVTGSTTVNISGNSIIGADGSGGGYVYAAARGDEGMGNNCATVGSTVLNISGGTVWGSAFGGGQLGTVKGNVAVNVSGGVVKNDVYGGGALANTNTDNWNTPGSATTYVVVTDLNEKEYYSVISKKEGDSVDGYYTYNGTTYVAATGTAVKDVTYYQKLTGAPIAGYYTKSGDVYTLQTSGTAQEDVTYYKRVVVGSWADGMNNNETGTQNKTTVILTGGSVGNVYGGGLGSSTVAANVYGDVKITVNKPEELTSTGGSGIAFSYKSERVTFGEGDKSKEYVIPLTGRVFGCNNINGTPTGNVRVEVYSTRQADEDGKLISTTEHSPNGNISRYEIQGVYGGGNLSDYLPAEGKATSVYIGECDVTSIEKVYGGGNSASVPTSNVTINGSFDIGYAFGGGNGGDLIKKDGVWYENAGAIVISQAYIAPIGGKIGAVFGGSDAKGNCGSIVIDKSQTNPSCPLRLLRLYGAGNEADVDNVNIIISGCSGGANAEIEYVYGGSYNANVEHDVTLTITAGKFKNIYGGNDRTGSIGGNITVNIEETDNCMPITIQNLLGGGYQAPYPGTKRDGTEITTPGKIFVNVKSATRIDNIYGGSFKADVNGDTQVNINMTKGWWAGKTYDSEDIPNSVGSIGNIYGGGNQGLVRGNSTVNIATATTVGYVTEPIHLRTNSETPITKEPDNETGLYYVPVTGARITGDVFGGGNEANVNGNATVNICTADYSGVTGFEGVSISDGSVYGGGSAADVLGNTNVNMGGGYVFDGVYGGGLHGSVGTVTARDLTGHTSHEGCVGGKPTAFAENTGKCTVVINGGQIGPVEVALAGGGMKNTDRYFIKEGDDTGPVDYGFVFGAGRGEVEDPAVNKDTDFSTFVKETDVTIGGTAFIMASVYGGGENGRVAGDTHVTITGNCQIGCGEGKVTGAGTAESPYVPQRYDWTDEEPTNYTECASWDYAYPYLPYDPYASNTDPEARKLASDGHTYYGNVFGGGSGYYPYEIKNIVGTVTGHEWLRSAGQVYGKTQIDITGGHILTSVYGGNEMTDVGTYTREDGQIVVSSGGKCTINMVGGTLGVPRIDDDAKKHPVTCYLFGAGKGDQRTHFNTWTNVQETEVNVSGSARIFGSVFGGGEDGHVLGNAVVNIGGIVKIDLNGDGDTTDSGETFTADSGLKIGTTGTSYVDGNVFGGGRGFSGVALTAGSTGGNATVNIAGGTMLGSVYGGGRLASVGIDFTPAEDPSYGQLVDDTNDKTHGHIAINISGGTIGNGTTEAGAGHPVSGNVFGGSMGRITFLDDRRNPLWPKQAVVKLTEVNISGGTIYNSVYGGGELGVVRNRATVNVEGGTIHGNVFGGGYGSDEQDKATITAGGYASIPTLFYTFTPMIWTGCVSGDTFVNISGGRVEKNVYGGGNFASVGLMNFNSNDDGTVYNYITKHEDLTNSFGLSWPYEFQYIQHAPNDLASVGGQKVGGKATINITGGRIGTTHETGYGNVFGGSKGMVTFKREDNTTPITNVNEQRYTEAFCANVRETEVNINYTGETPSSITDPTACIVGNVYGGGQDGHVYEDAKVRIANGLIGLSVYGGGEGESTFEGTLRDQSTKDWKGTTELVHSITAGKVYGNTSVSMSGGHVIGHIYGGGNLASVGKGNYSGGADDYYKAGYGETLTGNLWTSATEGDNAWHFLNSGNVTVSIAGGSVGSLNGTTGTVYGSSDATPTGMVFGGSRGRASQDIMLDPRHEYAPDFYLGYVNKATVTIGDGTGDGPRIYSQVFGGGRDGHVRNNTHVIINNGTIGQTYAESESATDPAYQRYHRGNVYGAGSGLGMWNGTNHGTSSGSVTNSTRVDIYGGTIYNNVYGGGAMACVGPPLIGTTKDYAGSDLSKCTVNIYGGTIGDVDVYNAHKYGGTIYGGSRGDRGGDLATGESIDSYATVLWTEVNINPHPTNRTLDAVIAGNVYGGARGGQVKKDTKVNLTGGVIKHNAYGGGRGTTIIAADVLGNTTVELNKDVASTAKGCIVNKVFGCNDQNGTPKGHALVHVYATQHKNKEKISYTEGGKYDQFGSMENGYSTTNYSGLETLASETGTDVSAYTAILSGGGDENTKKAALDNMIEAIADDKYDVLGVYGGGDLAEYEPTDPNENTEVIIDGCDLTSIKQVYGGGNAASTPANLVRINEAYEIHEVFGGGNGKDAYEKDGYWYENSGANVGYYTTYHYDTSSGGAQGNPYHAIVNEDADTPEERRANYSYGKGTANLIITGGRIHSTYGGSNIRGNVRAEVVTSTEDAGSCTMLIDNSTTAGKNADTDGGSRLDSRCIDYLAAIYGGATDANVYNDVVIDITNGTYGKIFGGNNLRGKIYGSITINVREEGCKPIVIGELYGGGNEADYSIYGFNDDGSARTKAQYDVLDDATKATITVRRDPQINIISATRIGTIYGGGLKAKVIGSPSINVNMEEGFVAAKYAEDAKYNVGYHELTEHEMDCSYDVLSKDNEGKAVLKIGTIGTIFGGGSQGDVDGDTRVDIGTGKHLNFAGEEEIITPARNAAFIMRKQEGGGQVYGGGNEGDVYGNANITLGNGYVYDRIYGGGKKGNVGKVDTREFPTGHASHTGCLGGKPTAFMENTGKCTVLVTGGYVGPYYYQRNQNDGTPIPIPMAMQGTGADGVAGPDDYGYVFGAGQGELVDPEVNIDVDFETYVDNTVVTIQNGYETGYEGDAEHITRPLIAGGVYGGSERGRVLNDTYVYVKGGQIGLGKDMTTAFTEDQWTAAVDAVKNGNAATINTLATETFKECASWAYASPWLPYDEHAGMSSYDSVNYGAASTTGTDGHTFYGNVFGGGSGYFSYPKGNNGETNGYDWLMSCGMVEGNTHLEISGGHILTNVYGGNEMTDVKGTSYVTMTGGTLGVPRTLAQIAAHPVTCYLFGGGKGDTRVHFNKNTNVANANVNITSNAFIFGSAFGGGEDGHVMGDVNMTISDFTDTTDPENPVTSSPWIGTWGTSYVEGNIFGGGRGFSAEAYTAGNVAGSVNLDITGGTMLGSIYGGGRLASVGYGLYMATETEAATGHMMYGEMQDDNYDDWYNPGSGYVHPARSNFKRGHITLNISGGTIGNKYEFIYPDATNIAAAGITGVTKIEDMTAENWTTWKNYHNVPNTSFDTSNGRVTHTKGGNVFAGGMGRRVQLDGVTEISAVDWRKLGNVKSTNLTISGTPWIMGNVYGGCELGMVRTSEATEANTGTTKVTITGGTIGTEVTGDVPTKTAIPLPATYPNSGNSNVKYTYGIVYGGGMGAEVHELVEDHGGNVDGNTTVSISGNDTEIRASVFGGSELATVGGNTYVTISGGKIGRKEVKALDDANAGYVMFGGATMGNVYGGGKGHLEHTLAGLVKGNTNVTITGGNVYHMVFGGGALGSVGDFKLSKRTESGYDPIYIPADGIPYDWKDGTGTATVSITGGTIGISGRDNGLVFGSSRGGLQKPEADEYGLIIDPYDKVAWVNKSVVNIGTEGKLVTDGDYLTAPLIKGSVYGGGENGHNDVSAEVNVYSGTIGISDENDPWYSYTAENLNSKAQSERGNVYGAGSGSDTYTGDDGKEHYNQKSGMVAGHTTVNIKGGHVGRSVYGSGSMAMVGTIMNVADTVSTKNTTGGIVYGQDHHHDETNSFALSWPYKFEFAPETGKTTVNITGGHIGTRNIDGGDVFGSSRGLAGDRYQTAHLAYVNETEVNIDYPETYAAPEGTELVDKIGNDFTTQCITGSVHGSGEDGYVYGDTHVTLNKGLVGHSLYGAGKGSGQYTKSLNKIDGSGTYEAKIYSLISGRVMGNTYVTMNDGHVGRNVYGGGNMGSVGKGNYASGTDDYYPSGYGEKIAGNLWTSSYDPDQAISESNKPDDAYFFLSSGKTTVKVLGGTVGYINKDDPTKSIKNNLPYGNVFGGSAGEAAPNVPAALSPRYEYCPEFYSGYVNETDVTIGKSRSDFAEGDAGDAAYATYKAKEAGTDGAGPKILASVYGGGQDGHVRRDTKVTVNVGEIGLTYTDNQTLLKTADVDDVQWLYRGNVYGGGSGISTYAFDFDNSGKIESGGSTTIGGVTYKESDYSTSAGSVTRLTEVNILGGTIHRSVYGGGSMGSVGAPPIPPTRTDLPDKKDDTTEGHGKGWWSQNTVTIKGGTVGTPTGYNPLYGGNVFGACRGISGLDENQYATSIWTQVNILNGATIMGSVFGGGDSGLVKKDTDVQIGEKSTE